MWRLSVLVVCVAVISAGPVQQMTVEEHSLAATEQWSNSFSKSDSEAPKDEIKLPEGKVSMEPVIEAAPPVVEAKTEVKEVVQEVLSEKKMEEGISNSTAALKIPTAPPMPSDVSSVDMVIAVTTMRRWTHDRQPSPYLYLTELINGVEDYLTDEQRKHVSYMLYNVDKEPEKHVEVSQLKNKLGDRMEVLVKAPQKPPSEQEQEAKVALHYSDGITREITRQTAEWISGETRDATNLLFEARKRAPYVLFLEDDVKPTQSVISKLNNYVAELKVADKNDWFMIDLYTPKIDWGRNPLHVNRLERYDYECCTQAMLFRSDRLLDMLLFETLHPSNPLDDNIRDFSREDYANRGVYALVPNGFEHIGRHSSNPEKSSDTVEHQSINFVP